MKMQNVLEDMGRKQCEVTILGNYVSGRWHILNTMTNRSDNLLKRTLIDIGGILLLILAMLVGWLPGPLGIPLVIAGLGLLSINHEWAEHLRERIKSNGIKIMEKVFSDKPVIKWSLDIASLLLVAMAVFIISTYEHRLLNSLAIAMAAAALFIFLANRKRLARLLSFAKLKR